MKKNKSKWGKMMSRDIVVAYIVFTVGLLMNMGIYMTLPETESCTLYTKTGGVLEGNCTYLSSFLQPTIEYDRAYAEKYQETFQAAVEKVKAEQIQIRTTCPECEECKPNLNKPVQCSEPVPCVCDICSRCPQCPTAEFELNTQQIDWLLNDCNLRKGASCYQSGSADTCDAVRDYLEVPGRPKFRSRPSTTGFIPAARKDLICFKDLGEYSFIVNRTPDQNNRTRWGWNDNECKTSVLNIHKL